MLNLAEKMVAGPGRKQCPGCQSYVGVRTHFCACGHSFTGAAKPVEIEDNVIATYDAPGKGKKQCPACQKYVGARSTECACGHVFSKDKTEKEESVAVTYDEGGRGKKQCPACQKYVGAKTHECACGHTFQPKGVANIRIENNLQAAAAVIPAEAPILDPRNNRQVLHGVRRKYVMVPAGACPYKLVDSSENTVTKWIENIIAHGERQGDIYTAEAVRYWAGWAYKDGGHDYDEFLKSRNDIFCVINELVPHYNFN